MYKPIYPGSYYFNTFTFTSLGNSGHLGPTPDQTYADAPWPSSSFSIKNGQQSWTVPANGVYQITAAGAYGATPGRVVTGQVKLSQGQVVTMLVGQQPTPLTANVLDNVTVGGGGGTFVVTNGVPLIVASGGDGSGPTSSPGSFSYVPPSPPTGVVATGGTVTTYTTGGTTYKVHTFTSSGTFNVTSGGPVDVLLVGGGGGGGYYLGAQVGGGGGGGGGQVVYQTGVSVSLGSFPVTVGSGGLADTLATSSNFLSISALPGGNAAIDISAGPGAVSGSGKLGGGVTEFSYPVTGGGGGGDSEPGQDTTLPDASPGGAGGDGTMCAISGTPTYYGGGGGGSSYEYTTPLTNYGGLGGGGYGFNYFGPSLTGIPVPNSGGGSGGGWDGAYIFGATGIVIIRYSI